MKITLRRIAAVVFLFFISKNITAQYTFQKTFGNPNHFVSDDSFDMAMDFNNNYYTIGSNDFSDFIMTKIDSIGTIVWSKGINIGLGGIAHKIICSKDSNLIIMGQNSMDSSFAPYLSILKTDTGGNVIWSKNYLISGGIPLNTDKIIELSNGELIIGATIGTYDTISFNTYYSAYFIKTDSIGNLKWMKKTDSKYNLYLYDLNVENPNSYIMTGVIDSIGFGNSDMLVMKFDSSGNVSQSKILGSVASDYGIKIMPCNGNGWLLFGLDRNNIQSISQMHFIRLDASLNVLWNKEYLTSNDYYFLSSSLTNDSAYIVSGTGTGPGLMKIDTNATCIWATSVNISGTNQILWKIMQTKDKGFAASGSIFLDTDVLFFKSDSLGNTSCSSSFQGNPFTESFPILYDSTIILSLTDTASILVVSDSVFSNVAYVDSMYCFSSTGLYEINNLENTIINIYPNPASDYINIEFNNYIFNNIILTFFNSMGMKVYEFKKQKLEAETRINTMNWAAGVYFCKILIPGLVSQKNYKIIIQK